MRCFPSLFPGILLPELRRRKREAKLEYLRELGHGGDDRLSRSFSLFAVSPSVSARPPLSTTSSAHTSMLTLFHSTLHAADTSSVLLSFPGGSLGWLEASCALSVSLGLALCALHARLHAPLQPVLSFLPRCRVFGVRPVQVQRRSRMALDSAQRCLACAAA